ncbi:exosortase/archaeosortase family protein [Poriferisphaera sp. WC338]|uniref:exosortase/archaeosortase family protein n=1 Tax=Poriferisphaera sp. WC338 TaxID=3425129 RepID=UPI003D81C2F4
MNETATLEQPKTLASSVLPEKDLIPSERIPWVIALAIGFCGMHWAYLYRMGRIAWNDPNWSHAMIVPLISIYFIYQQRETLKQIKPSISWFGLPLVFFGLFAYVWGITPGRNDMAQGYAMIISLFGMIWFLLGSKMMRVLWFPIIYLGFGVKVSPLLWEAIAVKLQFIAAYSSTVVLKFCSIFLDFEVDNRGSTIDIITNKQVMIDGIIQMKPVTESLNVAEACAGLRMLMAFLALGVAMAFLWKRPKWQRVVMVLMTVPIAITVNVGRVTSLGLLSLVNKEMVGGDFHTFVGMVMLIPAAGMFLLMGWIMDKLFISDKSKVTATSDNEAKANNNIEPDQRSQKFSIPISNYVISFIIAAITMVGAFYLYTYTVQFSGIRIANSAIINIVFKMMCILTPPTLLGFIVCLASIKLLNRWNHLPLQAKHSCAAIFTMTLLITAFSSQAVVLNSTQTVIFKKAINPRHQMYALPNQVGDWKLYREDPPMTKEILDALGTNNYVSRTYVDERWPKDEPGRYIRLHSAYYTGTPDTVPHVPDRCYVAGGANIVTQGSTKLTVKGPEYFTDEDGTLAYSRLHNGEVRIPQTKDIPATFIQFVMGGDKIGQKKATSNVAYFFAANGKFLASPNDVRFFGTSKEDLYAYYCKIEVRTDIEDAEQAKARIEDFLSAYLPEVMACLPDWIDVTEGRYPRGVEAEQLTNNLDSN